MREVNGYQHRIAEQHNVEPEPQVEQLHRDNHLEQEAPSEVGSMVTEMGDERMSDADAEGDIENVVPAAPTPTVTRSGRIVKPPKRFTEN